MAPTDLSSFQTWYDANYVSVGGVQQVRYDYAINNFDTDNNFEVANTDTAMKDVEEDIFQSNNDWLANSYSNGTFTNL